MMKRIPLIIVAALFTVTAGIAGTIIGGTMDWPVGSAGTQTTTRTIYNSFGNYHVGWDTLTTPDLACNFHMGIDILPYNDNRDVRASRSGFISHILFQGDQYVVVVVDDTLSSTYGWSYQHLDNPNSYGWGLTDSITLNDQIAEMESLLTTNHMHLSWSPYTYNMSMNIFK